MNIEDNIEHAMNLKKELEKTDKETWTKQEVNDFCCRTCQFYDEDKDECKNITIKGEWLYEKACPFHKMLNEIIEVAGLWE